MMLVLVLIMYWLLTTSRIDGYMMSLKFFYHDASVSFVPLADGRWMDGNRLFCALQYD